MPGINTAGTPNVLDYNIGRGVAYFASVDANGFPKEFRDLGNCTDFKVSVSSETVEHKSSRAGLKVIDKKVNISLDAKVSFTLDEPSFDNLAMFMSGGTQTVSQSSGTVAQQAGKGNVKLSGKGRWYDLWDNAMATTGFAYPPTSGNRIYSLSSVVVKDISGATTYTLNTDYTLDLVWGRIFIVATGAIGSTDEISVSYTKAAKTIDQVNGLTSSSIVGALKFIQLNAANNSVASEWQFHAVTLTPSGDFGLVGDDFGSMAFDGSVESRPLVDANAPVVRVRYYT